MPAPSKVHYRNEMNTGAQAPCGAVFRFNQSSALIEKVTCSNCRREYFAARRLPQRDFLAEPRGPA